MVVAALISISTGRAPLATWLKRKQDAGEDIEKYLIRTRVVAD
jgi:hypothetical protein